MSKQTNKLGSLGEKKIPQQKNPCQERRCKVSLPPDAPSSRDGAEDRDPNPGVKSGPHKPPPHIRRRARSLRIGCHVRNGLQPYQRDKNERREAAQASFWKDSILSPPPVFLDDSIPIEPGLKLIVDIPVDPCRITDFYIDDFISLAVDIEGTDNLQRCDCPTLLAFDSCLQLLNEN